MMFLWQLTVALNHATCQSTYFIVWLIVSELYYYHCVIKFNNLQLFLYELMGYHFIILVCSIYCSSTSRDTDVIDMSNSDNDDERTTVSDKGKFLDPMKTSMKLRWMFFKSE